MCARCSRARDTCQTPLQTQLLNDRREREREGERHARDSSSCLALTVTTRTAPTHEKRSIDWYLLRVRLTLNSVANDASSSREQSLQCRSEAREEGTGGRRRKKEQDSPRMQSPATEEREQESERRRERERRQASRSPRATSCE